MSSTQQELIGTLSRTKNSHRQQKHRKIQEPNKSGYIYILTYMIHKVNVPRMKGTSYQSSFPTSLFRAVIGAQIKEARVRSLLFITSERTYILIYSRVLGCRRMKLEKICIKESLTNSLLGQSTGFVIKIMG